MAQSIPRKYGQLIYLTSVFILYFAFLNSWEYPEMF